MGILHKHLTRTLPQHWEQVLEDPRRYERSWAFGSLLQVVVNALVSGCKSLREVEILTETSGARVPDTTLHDLLVQIDPEPLNEELAKGVKDANRNHELDNKELPFRLTVIDGKTLSVTDYEVDEHSINRSQKGCTKYVHHALRAFHVSSTVKLLMAQQMVPRGTNENGTLRSLLEKLVELYGRTNLLEVLSMDAGFTGADNAQAIIDHQLHYIFAIKAPEMHPIAARAIELLGNRTRPDKKETEYMNGKHITRSLFRCRAPAVNGWSHATELWRMQKETLPSDGRVTIEDHYYVTSLPTTRLCDSLVLKTIRMHWGIENSANWVMDVAWEEDLRPWCNQALELLTLLRMIAYNAVARFKFRRFRRAKTQHWSWEQLLRFIQRVLFVVQDSSFATL